MLVESSATRNPLLQGDSEVTDLSGKLKKLISRCKKRVVDGTTETEMTKKVEEDPVSWLLIFLYSIRFSFGSIGAS